MIRVFQVSGNTAGITLSPGNFWKWRMLYAVIVLHTSSTSGTRTLSMYVTRGLNYSEHLLTSISESTVSSDFYSVGDVAAQGAGSNGAVYQWAAFPEFIAKDTINVTGTLVTGDTFDYMIVVEEMIA